MSFPIANKGPFEDENNEWCRHVAATFVEGVTGPMLASPGCDPAHAAVAHFQGFLCCAFQDAVMRGDGADQITADILEQVRPFLSATMNGDVVATVVENPKPLMTVLTGGKEGS
ncbi:hypothetical protein X727_32885 [Mesorhizobium sp. L103C119B0]|uniref:hypothetical protein n=1 Tax=Mesorhizobium sp. L103C119B0 TaxID=1287085 RepID=UPI0003CFF65E|nr:hypothetical protein [Mesorhizobium sp. L103C119B0]ESZ56664.1 hypothetical protein X727_32885 [Mesorhizobium sp. L103C119B0]